MAVASVGFNELITPLGRRILPKTEEPPKAIKPPGFFMNNQNRGDRMQKRSIRAFIASALALAAQGAFAVDFQAVGGDGVCPSGLTMVTPDVAYTYKSEACKAIGNNASARIANGDSMSNYTSGCKVKHKDAAPQPATLCDRMPFQVVNGDNTCPAGSRLATVQEAALFNSQACAALKGNQWYIARLADGGAIKGPGYSCAVTADESKPLGNSLCTTAPAPAK